MKKQYIAPRLICDEYAPDTMIASGGWRPYNPNTDTHIKNGTFNPNCFGYNAEPNLVNDDGDFCN